jgi:hypothetical protein
MAVPTPTFPLTLAALAPRLAMIDVFCTLPSWQQASQAGVAMEQLRVQYQRFWLGALRDVQPSAFWQRSCWGDHRPFQPREGTTHTTPDDASTWAARLLHEEFTRFCQATHTEAAARNQILADLVDAQTGEPASLTVRARLLELLFLPGMVFAWGGALDAFAARLPPFHREIRQQLTALDHHFDRTAPYFQTHPAHAQHTALRAALQRVLGDAERTVRDVARWKKTVGITTTLAIAPTRQRLWTPLFLEMLPLLRPFCRGPKAQYLARTDALPDAAFRLASALMHLAHPDLWPDQPRLIHSRWQAHCRTTKQ